MPSQGNSPSLVLLAENRQLQSKHAGAMLWPTVDQNHALHSLNQALYALRRIVGKDAAITEGATIRLTTTVRWDNASCSRYVVRSGRRSLRSTSPGGMSRAGRRHHTMLSYQFLQCRQTQRCSPSLWPRQRKLARVLYLFRSADKRCAGRRSCSPRLNRNS
jgi:hypothetical protein